MYCNPLLFHLPVLQPNSYFRTPQILQLIMLFLFKLLVYFSQIVIGYSQLFCPPIHRATNLNESHSLVLQLTALFIFKLPKSVACRDVALATCFIPLQYFIHQATKSEKHPLPLPCASLKQIPSRFNSPPTHLQFIKSYSGSFQHLCKCFRLLHHLIHQVAKR